MTAFLTPRSVFQTFSALLFVGLLAGGAGAYPETQVRVHTSMQAEFAGHAQGAFYVIDSGLVRQYDPHGKLRHSQPVPPETEFRFSPNGYYYVIIQTAKSDSARTPYTLFDVMHREVYQGEMYSGGKLFLDNDGRCVLSKPRTGASVELEILGQGGERLGIGTAARCDTVVFAPDTRGFIATGVSRGLTYLRLTGERIASYPPSEVFGFSVSGRRVGLFDQGVISLYEDERLVATYRAPSVSAIKIIYQDSKNRVFLLTRKNLYSLKATDGYTLLDYRALGEGWIYTDIGYTEESDLLALTFINSLGSKVETEKRARQSSLRILTPTGDEYRLIHGYTERARDGYPRVQMGSRGDSVFFILGDEFQKVTW